MKTMKKDELIYLLSQYYSMFAIPVRLYENNTLLFQKIPFLDSEDPVCLVFHKIMNGIIWMDTTSVMGLSQVAIRKSLQGLSVN